MHELGITRNIVAIVTEHAGDNRVARVTIDIGKLSAILPDAIQFCFDACTKGTSLENAVLEINEIPGLGRCEACGAEIALEQKFGHCDCGSNLITCIAGDEMIIREMALY